MAAASPARFVVAIASGKGGVGKSTICLNLALCLSELGSSVGILDADVYGPDIPLMVNLTRTVHAKNWMLWRNPAVDATKLEPVERHGVKIMSTGFVVGEDQAIVWDANLVRLLLNQFLHQTDWGDLDYLLVDLPPGTADLQQTLVQMIPLSGVVVCVTPQDVAHLDCKKAVEMYRSRGVAILGGVENMTGLVCPHCGELVDVLPPVRQDRSIWSAGIPKLGSVPMDPAVAVSTDAHTPMVLAHPDSPASKAYHEIARQLSQRLAPAP